MAPHLPAGTEDTREEITDPRHRIPDGNPHDGTARAECVLCREPTEHPQTVKGAPLCPVCEWQEAQRIACSG